VSGLDFADPRHPARPGRRVPTLTVLPRGNFFGGRTGRGYNHPALHTPGALGRLVDEALARFGAHTGIQAVRGRLILTAHSGGGASLMRMLAYADPDEVHTFDALYPDPSPLITWACARIARNDGGALRVLFRDHEGTAAHSRAVRSAVRSALAAHPATAPARFRVEATPVEHMQIPPRFGWRLLADARADVPSRRPAPPPPALRGGAARRPRRRRPRRAPGAAGSRPGAGCSRPGAARGRGVLGRGRGSVAPADDRAVAPGVGRLPLRKAADGPDPAAVAHDAG